MRMMPYNLESEKYLLGAVLHNSKLFKALQGSLTVDAFFDDRNKKIFKTMQDIFKSENDLDIIILAEHLSKNKVNITGGNMYLLEISESFTSEALFDQHERIVKERYVAREEIKHHEEQMIALRNQAVDVFDSMESTLKKMSELRSSLSKSEILEPKDYIQDFQQWYSDFANGKFKPLPSGLKQMDDLTGGFYPTELTVIAARPSHGKTALALSLIYNQSFEPFAGEPIPTGLISLEMDYRQLMLRMASMSTREKLKNLRNVNKIEYEAQKNKIIEVTKQFADGVSRIGNLYISDKTNITEYDIQSIASKMVDKHGIKILYVDYLQLITPGEKTDSRERQIANISRVLKLTAHELDIPIVTLAQLNRKNETENRQPRASDLRDSGAIEQDADVVILLDRPEMRKVEKYSISGDDMLRDSKNRIVIGVEKNRQGPTGKFDALFAKDFVQVMEDNDHRFKQSISDEEAGF